MLPGIEKLGIKWTGNENVTLHVECFLLCSLAGVPSIAYDQQHKISLLLFFFLFCFSLHTSTEVRPRSQEGTDQEQPTSRGTCKYEPKKKMIGYGFRRQWQVKNLLPLILEKNFFAVESKCQT